MDISLQLFQNHGLENKFEQFVSNHDVLLTNQKQVISAYNEKKLKKPSSENELNPYKTFNEISMTHHVNDTQ